MKIISADRLSERDFEALLEYLEYCRESARESDHYKVASISLGVKHIDPLAVLQSIYETDEWHFYMEHPVGEEAIAGAEAILCGTYSGSDRFGKVRRFAGDVLNHTIAIGELENAFSGPHFFCGFTFFEDKENISFFEPATVFLPRWQVTRKEGAYSAVANILVQPDSELGALAERVWVAHEKFSSFQYEKIEAIPPANPAIRFRFEEVGGEGCFESAVETALSRISEGKYDKIVLARSVELEMKEFFKPLESLNGLRKAFPGCHSFSIANGEGQSFIGASPERLLRSDGGFLKTDALAGSAPRGETAGEDARMARWLLESEKNHREHRVVVDSIVRRLKASCISPEVSERPQLFQLSHVQHLRSPITATLPPEMHFLDIAAILHPTPAVGGAPREAAIPDIRAIENFERGLYAGTVGWFDYRGHGEMIVAIRSALIDGKRARVYAGNGIVEGSDPREEKKEADLKMQALLISLR